MTLFLSQHRAFSQSGIFYADGKMQTVTYGACRIQEYLLPKQGRRNDLFAIGSRN